MSRALPCDVLSKDCAFIQLTFNAGRTVDQKRAFDKAIADGLHERLRLRREDVVINMVEVSKENWSYSNGKAQYAKSVHREENIRAG